jgi:hypothetical protein
MTNISDLKKKSRNVKHSALACENSYQIMSHLPQPVTKILESCGHIFFICVINYINYFLEHARFF